MFKTIVIATDGSSDGERALALARSIAIDTLARLVIVHVTEIVGGKGGLYAMPLDDELVKVSMYAQVELLRADGIDARVITQNVRLGGPAFVIADIADSVDADLIVVGSRGRAPLTGAVLGSVSARLQHIAHRPVLVVPRPAKTASHAFG